MKLILKLVIVAIVANATFRVGSAYASHYRFTDAVQEATQFRGEKTDEQMHDRILELAVQYDIPVNDDNLTVRHEQDHTIVDGAYKRSIQIVPGVTYQWPFTVHVDTFQIGAAKSVRD